MLKVNQKPARMPACKQDCLPHLVLFVLSAAMLGAQVEDAEILRAAAAEYKKIIQLDPRNAEAHARLGMTYNRLGKLAESTQAFERALQLDPKLPRVNVLLAFNYMTAGRYHDAIPLLAANFDAEPDSRLRLLVGQRLVECYFATGDEQHALGVVQKLRQIAPDNPDVLYTALKTYMNLWNDAFHHLMNKSPDSYRAHQVTAESLEAQQRFAEAAVEYQKVIELAPHLPGVHFQLGRMILRSDSSPEGEQKALAAFQREIAIAPAAPALAEIGEIYLRRKQVPEASREFSRALELQPGYVPARVGLAKIFLAEKQWSKALEQLETAQKLAPRDEAVAYNLMLAYRGLGRTEEAKRAADTFQKLKRRTP